MIYISNLNKNLWPLYTPPLPDEIFSSWLVRLSSKHNSKPEEFFEQFFNKKLHLDKNDIDLLAKPDITNVISKHTLLHLEEINQLFLSSYDSYVFENIHSKETLFNSYQFLKTRNFYKDRNGYQFCPKCLIKKTPYFKKKWKLSTSIICTECNCYLIDSCPNCHTPLTYQKSNKLLSADIYKPGNICNCGYNISSFSSPLIPSELEIEYQEYINSTIKNGYNDISQYSFTYLKILILIAFKLHKHKKSKLFQKILDKQSIFLDLTSNIEHPFERWNLEQRKHFLPLAYLLLKNFPSNMKGYFHRGVITKKDFGQLPYWFEKELIFS